MKLPTTAFIAATLALVAITMAYYSAAPYQTAPQLTTEEVQWLVYMREEEKLARDVYQTLGDQWGTQIFTNIAASEQTHTDSVRSMLERYDIPDPVADDTVGAFTSPELATLYTSLVAEGATSELAALRVGATIEDLDIHDLDKARAVTTHDDILTLYANLQKGSRNHLRSFSKTLNARGFEYEPQYISPDAYSAILSAPQERGPF